MKPEGGHRNFARKQNNFVVFGLVRLVLTSTIYQGGVMMKLEGGYKSSSTKPGSPVVFGLVALS